MNILKKLTLALFLATSLSACTNNYEKFFEGEYAEVNYAQTPNSSDEVNVLYREVGENTFREMLENGFAYKGHSGWTGPAQGVSYAKTHAANIGASHVIITNKLLNTETKNIPLTLPDTKTTYHGGNYGGSSYGSYGGSTYSGTNTGSYSGTSTTYGTKTTYIPVTTNTYETHAYYFVRVDTSKYRFGASFLEVPSEMSSQIGVNGGVQLIVIRNTPAYNADFISGDVVVEVSGERIAGPTDLQKRLIASTASETFKVYRNGDFISLTLDFSKN
jgi:serine protease Do